MNLMVTWGEDVKDGGKLHLYKDQECKEHVKGFARGVGGEDREGREGLAKEECIVTNGVVERTGSVVVTSG